MISANTALILTFNTYFMMISILFFVMTSICLAAFLNQKKVLSAFNIRKKITLLLFIFIVFLIALNRVGLFSVEVVRI